MKKAFRASSKQHVLFTAIAVLTLAHSALAADTGDPRPAIDVASTELADAIPTRLDQWGETSDEIDLKEFSVFSLAASPRQGGRKGATPPFIDFERLELGGMVGAVKYSSDFKAGVGYVAAFTSHVPVPGIALGEWGLWGNIYVGYVDRQLPFYYTNDSGVWFGGALGLDFMLVSGEVAFLRVQAGAMYAYWNNTAGLVSGIGGIAGLQLGFHWIRSNQKSSMTINPQLSITGKSYAIFIPVGISIDF